MSSKRLRDASRLPSVSRRRRGPASATPHGERAARRDPAEAALDASTQHVQGIAHALGSAQQCVDAVKQDHAVVREHVLRLINRSSDAMSRSKRLREDNADLERMVANLQRDLAEARRTAPARQRVEDLLHGDALQPPPPPPRSGETRAAHGAAGGASSTRLVPHRAGAPHATACASAGVASSAAGSASSAAASSSAAAASSAAADEHLRVAIEDARVATGPGTSRIAGLEQDLARARAGRREAQNKLQKMAAEVQELKALAVRFMASARAAAAPCEAFAAAARAADASAQALVARCGALTANVAAVSAASSAPHPVPSPAVSGAATGAPADAPSAAPVAAAASAAATVAQQQQQQPSPPPSLQAAAGDGVVDGGGDGDGDDDDDDDDDLASASQSGAFSALTSEPHAPGPASQQALAEAEAASVKFLASDSAPLEMVMQYLRDEEMDFEVPAQLAAFKHVYSAGNVVKWAKLIVTYTATGLRWPRRVSWTARQQSAVAKLKSALGKKYRNMKSASRQASA